MKAASFSIALAALAVALVCAPLALADELAPIHLPKPTMEGGKPLMEALKDRHSSREFSEQKLSAQVLSNLLWAAFGINRPEQGKRTAPSASNRQEIDIYVATAEGLFLFDAKGHLLKPVLAEDIRGETGFQPFVKTAAVNLVYVADYSKMGDGREEDKLFYSGANTGVIAQNVYLFCASEGLGTVIRGLVNRPSLAKVMGLREDQKITLAQSVGYPEK